MTSPSVNSSGGVSATFVYDADGELVDTTDADGRRTTYSYDSLGDETGETWLNSSGGAIYTATLTYDSARELTGADDADATLTMAYDSDGQLGTMVTSGPGTGQPTVTLTYGYDPSGDVTGIKDSLSGSGAAGQAITTYQYDPALRLTTVTQSLGGTTYGEITITYDSGGRMTKEYESEDATGTIVITGDSYDAANDITGISSTTGTEGSPFIHTTFVSDSPTYNSDGEMTQICADLQRLQRAQHLHLRPRWATDRVDGHGERFLLVRPRRQPQLERLHDRRRQRDSRLAGVHVYVRQ